LNQLKVILFVILITFSSAPLFSQIEKSDPAPPSDRPSAPDFAKLSTKEGKVYKDCFVTRVEVDAITIRHSRGMARISLFSLSKELQDRYNFDPIAASRKADADEKIQRKTHWKLFWKKQKYEAAAAQKLAAAKLYQTAKQSWYPVEASIVKFKDSGAYVRARRILFLPTKVKSTLGFTVDGPPRRSTVPMSSGLIFIQNPFGKITALPGRKWKGYVESFPSGQAPNLSSGKEPVPRHRALPNNE